MAKKIEVDIAYLKSIGLSQKQISDIIKNSEPEHWTNNLPQGNAYYELLPYMITPEARTKERVTIYCANQFDPALSFFTEKDAEFIQNKCRLLVEMSNYSFAVNGNWCPDWNNKEEKKYGIVLQNGQARVSENELFNLYVFGIVTKTRSLALEMLEEYKEPIETYFNKPFNSFSENERECFGNIGHAIQFNDGVNDTTSFDNGTLNAINEINFIGSFAPRYETISTRKKRKSLVQTDIPKIQELLLNDVSQKEIAETFQYSQGTISRLKERLGFAMRKREVM
jgi:DNA-binding CsgD family transcriptional regulator